MKEHKELIKTVLITILVTANISFLAGYFYHSHETKTTNSAIKAQVDQLKVELSSPAK